MTELSPPATRRLRTGSIQASTATAGTAVLLHPPCQQGGISTVPERGC